MGMTKKHYLMIAETLSFYHGIESKYGNTTYIPHIAETLKGHFEHDNKKFDGQMFLNACGIVGS
jgi:hypothetical protein